MLQICILDDDEADGRKNEELLRSYFDLRHMEARMDRFQTGQQLLESTKTYHMLFLDIEIQEENGIDIAMELRKTQPDILIVVITSYVRYSLDGYKIQAARYLLKPIHEELLYSELDEILKTSDTSTILTHTMRQDTTMVKLKDILYFESHARRTIFHTLQGEYEDTHSVTFWAKQLQLYFVECHKGLFVQLRYIQKLNHEYVTLLSDEVLPLARRRIQAVHEVWIQYQEQCL